MPSTSATLFPYTTLFRSRMGVSVVGIESQTAIRARPQRHEPGVVVRVGEASAPIQRAYLRAGQGHRPGDEIGFQEEPECTGPVSRPEGIAVIIVKAGSRRCAGTKA